MTAKRQAPAGKPTPAGKAPQARRAPTQAKSNQLANVNNLRAPRKRVQPVPRSLAFAFDGFDKRHMPLDEVTAPYTTTNFISTMEFASATDMDQVIVVCPRVLNTQETHAGSLSDYIAMRYDASQIIDGTIATLQRVRTPIIDEPVPIATTQFSSVRARLHNMSVKLECLGTNTGLYPPGSAYIGTVPCIETGPKSTGAADSLSIKQAWATDSITVGYIKPLSAASLVDKPVIIDAAVAENVSYRSWRDLSVVASTVNLGSLGFSTALEPIVIYIPRAGAGTTVVDYRVTIGQQWCSRHPHNIMLRSTQKQHPTTDHSDWNRALTAVKDVGEHLLKRAGGAAVDAMVSRAQQAAQQAGRLELPMPIYAVD